MSDKIKVLVVDDSSLVRKIVTDILESDPEITVVGTANNGKTAIFRARELDPDVITMDIEMPIMDGLSALKYIVETNPKPVIMMSVLTQHGADATFKALDLGAVDFIPKPSSVVNLSVEEIGEQLIQKVRSVATSGVKIKAESPEKVEEKEEKPEPVMEALDEQSTSSRLIGIGTSTGGPSALLKVFQGFPANFPSSLVVVQHMPEGFTRAFSERLNGSSHLTVKEGEDGDKIKPGYAYIAPGNFQMEIVKKKKESYLKIYKGDKVSGHQPSIDVLFSSIAEHFGPESIGVIMTGMGRDGATGLKNIRNAGGFTLAQDETTSVVYGMNRVAVEEGGVREIVPLGEITKKIVEHI
jgi:two-component system chemotaxis response regulator CheB